MSDTLIGAIVLALAIIFHVWALNSGWLVPDENENIPVCRAYES